MVIQELNSAACFTEMLRLGMYHIAEGPDHILFLLTLLLAVPLTAEASRWSHSVSTRQSLMRVFKVVSAFTIGHSLTLQIATFGFIKVPSRPIEALIAASIFISAIHVLRPIFSGTRKSFRFILWFGTRARIRLCT